MAIIKSNEVVVPSNISEVLSFMSDLNNFEELMPDGKIQNWESSNDTCSFTIKGLAGIGMKRENNDSNNVHIVSHGKNPFDFTLDIKFTETENACAAQLTFDGNMNFMIQTMASGPLTNLFNIMADNLVKKFS